MNTVERKAALRAGCRIAKTGRILGSLAGFGLLWSGQASLIDRWEAGSLTGSVLDGGELILWPSENGINAWPDYSLFPLATYHANVTPAGGPVVRFAGSVLEVDAADSPLQGLSEFTLSVVVKVNAPSTRPGGAHWGSKTGLIDANESGVTADWGTALTQEGNLGFGVGQPDTTLYTASGSVVDDNFHVVVVTWKAGEIQKVYLDNWDPVAATGAIPADPRNAGKITFGGSSVRDDVDQLLSGDIAEIRFYDQVMTDSEALAEANDLAGIHGVQFTRLINSFTASATEINAGESLTLSWSVAPDAAVEIQPGIGDVTDQTNDGLGSLEVTPTQDTLYTLIATRDTTTNRAPIDIIVRYPAEDALVDVWDAATTTDGAVASWISANGRAAAASGGNAPTSVAAATPAGTPAVVFAGTPLTVSGPQNPLAGLTEATIAYVFKVDEAPTRNEGDSWWAKTGIIDASQDGVTNDWGCVLDENGQAGFGTGNPDVTLYSEGETLADDQWHVVVQAWNAGRMRLYVDSRPVVASAGEVSRMARDARSLVFGGLADANPEAMFVGQLAEVRFYSDGLAETEIAKVRDELSAKHGLGGGGTPIDPFLILDSGFDNDGHYFVTIESVSGVTYRLQRKAALGDAAWTDVASARASGRELTLTDTGEGSGLGFYRVVADASGGGTPIDPFLILDSGFDNDGHYFVSIESVSGVTYRLQRKAGLAEAAWTDVASERATGAELTLTDAGAGSGKGFYRVVADASGGGGTPFPILSAGFAAADRFAVTFEAEPGGAYELLKKDGLGDAAWRSVASANATSAELTLTDDAATNPNAFYRVARTR